MDHKEGKSVLYDPAAIARRKRMEIRRFRKLSHSVDLLPKDSSSVQICINLKRARPSTTAELCDSSEDSEGRGTHSSKLQKEEGDVFDQTKSKDLVDFTEQSSLLQPDFLKQEGSVSFHFKGKETVEFEGQSGRVRPRLLINSRPGLSSLDARCTIAIKPVFSDVGEGSEQLMRKGVNSDLQEPYSPRQRNVLRSPAMPGDAWFQCNKDVEVSSIHAGASSSVKSMAWTTYGLSTNQGCPPSGKLLLCGAKRIMADRVAIFPSFAQLGLGISSSTEKTEGKSLCFLHFYAVYDGHGSSRASQCCMERLHLVLAEELANICDVKHAGEEFLPCYWKNVMASCFSRIDKELGGFCSNKLLDDSRSATTFSGSIACESVGMTAVVAVVSFRKIVVASCGDSKAVLSRGGKAIPLSFDQEPEREDKPDFIEPAGGQAFLLEDQTIACLPAVPNTLGELYLKHFAVSKPNVTCIYRSKKDECLILASNGLWDVMSNEMACNIACKCLDSSTRMPESRTYEPSEDPASIAAAALLVKVAIGRGSKDNISVVVIDLKS